MDVVVVVVMYVCRWVVCDARVACWGCVSTGAWALGWPCGRWPAAMLRCHHVSDVGARVFPPVGVRQSSLDYRLLHVLVRPFRSEERCDRFRRLPELFPVVW